jgi:curved DNA-binding protein CbpA
MLQTSSSLRNHYHKLGVGFRATQEEIKQAYRELAKKYHPDQNPGDTGAEKKFMDVKKSYDFLSNKVNRAEYDRDLIKSGEARWLRSRPTSSDGDESEPSSSDTSGTLSRNQLIGMYGVMIGLPFLASLMRNNDPIATPSPPKMTPTEFWSQTPNFPEASPRDVLVRAYYNPISSRWERLEGSYDAPSPSDLFRSTRSYIKNGTAIPLPPKEGVQLIVQQVPLRITIDPTVLVH